MKYFFTLIVLLICQGFALGQFHEKEGSSGQVGMRQMNNPYSGTGVPSMSGGVPNISQRVIPSTPAYVMPTKLSSEKTGSHVKIAFQPRSMNKEVKSWGRAENHPDGTYTETIFDDRKENEKLENLVIQKTKRKSLTDKEDILVQTRQISLNGNGLPDEVLILDASGKPTYRGKFIYDPMGRILEEQLRSFDGTPLRRIVQKYSPTNEPLPLETYDYVKNLPKDLKLIVTPADQEVLDQLAEINNRLVAAEKSGKFNKKKLEAEARALQENFDRRNSVPVQPAPQVTASATPINQPATAASPETGGKKFQLFKRKPAQ
jgi:hypothetical protein